MPKIGTWLGPYEITAAIGAGGMGEVYRARDSRLDRTVAIKVLPAQLSLDERLRERFEREARAISALTHPHICTLYDVGSHEGVEFLVMEYLEGESLASRLARGPLPLDQVIRHGTEIAEALDKAHRAGIVHRDLKPGNVILTKGGAKLLDFGLAKFSEPVLSSRSAPDSPTAVMSHQKPLTEEGVIVGTLQYMAPEQIEGRDADARTDIFALGTLLYEMATGKRAFEAKTRASLIASILDREPPPISAVQPITPPALERVVKMCLAKDPDERWQSAHDVAAELRWIRDSSVQVSGPASRRTRRRAWLRSAAWLAAGTAIGAMAMWVARDATPPRRVEQYAIVPPANAPVWMGKGTIDVSPDGSRIAYRTLDGGQARLWVRHTATGAAKAVTPPSDHVRSPSFSPDGRWIAYLDERSGGLRKVSVDGGTPVTLTPDGGSYGLGVDWAGDTIYYARDFVHGIWAIGANGGVPRQVAKADPARNWRAILWPHVLPGGKTMLATAWGGTTFDDAKIVAFDLADGSSRVVIEGGSRAIYANTGHLLFGRGTNVMAVAFDPASATATGTPVVVATGVASDPVNGEALFTVSHRGDLLYVPGGLITDDHSLLWVDRAGRETKVVPTHRPYGDVRVSPDGRTIVATIETSTFDVWLLDPERDVLTRVSFGGDDLAPSFSPDGRWVLWSSSRHGKGSVYRAAIDGSSGEERLTNHDVDHAPVQITPDGRSLLINQMTAPSNIDVMLVPLDTRKPQPLLATRHFEVATGLSPDGKWLLYRSNESGHNEFYVRPFPGPGGKWQVSVGGGEAGQWAPSGREIVFSHSNRFYTVPVETAPAFRAGRPQLLFEREYDDWSIAPDGRMIAVKDDARSTSPRMHVVLNWTEDLKRRVPR